MVALVLNMQLSFNHLKFHLILAIVFFAQWSVAWPIDELLEGRELEYNRQSNLRYGVEIEVAPRFLRLRANEFDFSRVNKFRDNGDLFNVEGSTEKLAVFVGDEGERELQEFDFNEPDFISEYRRWQIILADYVQREEALAALPEEVRSQLTQGLNLEKRAEIEKVESQIIIPDDRTVFEVLSNTFSETVDLIEESVKSIFKQEDHTQLDQAEENKPATTIYLPGQDMPKPVPKANDFKTSLAIKDSESGIAVTQEHLNSKDWIELNRRWNALSFAEKINLVDFNLLSQSKKAILYTLYPDLVEISSRSEGQHIFKNVISTREMNHVVEYVYANDHIVNSQQQYLNDVNGIFDFFKITKKSENPLTESQEGFAYHLNISSQELSQADPLVVDEFIMNLNLLHLLHAHSMDVLHFNSLFVREDSHVSFDVFSMFKGGKVRGLSSSVKGPIAYVGYTKRLEVRSHVLAPKPELDFYSYYLAKPIVESNKEVEQEILSRLQPRALNDIIGKNKYTMASFLSLYFKNFSYIMKLESQQRDLHLANISQLMSHYSEFLFAKLLSSNGDELKQEKIKFGFTYMALESEILGGLLHLTQSQLKDLIGALNFVSDSSKRQSLKAFWLNIYLIPTVYNLNDATEGDKVLHLKNTIASSLVELGVTRFEALFLLRETADNYQDTEGKDNHRERLKNINKYFSMVGINFEELILFLENRENQNRLSEFHKSIISDFLNGIVDEKLNKELQFNILRAYRSHTQVRALYDFDSFLYSEDWRVVVKGNASFDFKKDLYAHLKSKQHSGKLDANEKAFLNEYNYLEKSVSNDLCAKELTQKK